MKIIISQRQYKKLTEGELKEAVGVPEYIISTAIKIFDKMVAKLKKENKSLDEIQNEKLIITGQFPMGDIVVRKIIIDFEFLKLPAGTEREWMSATHHSLSKLLPKLVFQTANKKSEIKIGFSIAMNEEDGNKELIDFLNQSKKVLIPTVAHEIKHSYFEKKSQYEPLKKRVSYQALQNLRLPMIQPINDFLFHSYFIHAVENVVRPTELAAHMEMQGITRKKFLEFFMNSDIVKMLKEIKDFSYQNLRDDLIAYTDVIKKLLSKIGVDTEGMSEEELVNQILRLTLVNLTNMRGNTMKSLLTTSPVEMIFGFMGDKEEFFDRYINYITKFGENYEQFFKSEENEFHKIADQMIKKLSKLYSLAKKDEE